MPSYKLYYFNLRAKGEICRMAFSAANIAFEDCRFNFGEEWDTLKKSGKPPLGQMPFLEEDGRILAQSGAIAKYICKKGGLSPNDPFQEAKADMICDGVGDLRNGLMKIFLEKEESKKEELKKEYFEKTLPDRLKLFEARLKEAGGSYFAGGKLTYADITFFEFFNGFLAKGEPSVPEELKAFELLTKHYNRVLNTPAIKAWIEKRPKSDF